jgi:hypothetical protein
VVTHFTFRARRCPPTVVAGFVVYPLDREVLAGLADVAAKADDAITTITFLRLAPPLPSMPPAVVLAVRRGARRRPGRPAHFQARSLSAPGSLIALFQLGGAAAAPEPASCVPFRSASFLVTYGSHWLDPAEDALHTAWTRAAVRAAAAFGMGGGYANFEGDVRGAPFPAPTLRRLAAVKRSLDSANVFRHNVNISPDHAG